MLKAFYARFEQSNTEACTRAPAVPEECVIRLSIGDVRKTFKQVNIPKATGQTDYQASVFTDIFNLSLTEIVIPTYFKQTNIFPVPKKAKVTCINDYHLVAHTSVAMKCFERLVMGHISSILPRPTPIPVQLECNFNHTPHCTLPPG